MVNVHDFDMELSQKITPKSHALSSFLRSQLPYIGISTISNQPISMVLRWLNPNKMTVNACKSHGLPPHGKWLKLFVCRIPPLDG